MQASVQMSVINPSSQADHVVQSKVVVVEHDPQVLTDIKSFFEECQLVGYRTTMEHAPTILGSTIDLGAIFLAEADSAGRDCFELVEAIHIVRPDLPIFLRLLPNHQAADLPTKVRQNIAGTFAYGDYAQARALVETFLFSRHYPTEFVSEMKEMTLAALQSSFKGMRIETEAPYIVKDKLIYGELFSLIPLESNWCRGYMTLQAEEAQVMEKLHARADATRTGELNFLQVNALLGELSNMIWGSFKTRYKAKELQTSLGQVRVEVPIIVNHLRKYISFGTDDPQLCFKYKVVDPAGKLETSDIYQKFVFSLDWAPEKYAESNQSVNELVNSGELELF